MSRKFWDSTSSFRLCRLKIFKFPCLKSTFRVRINHFLVQPKAVIKYQFYDPSVPSVWMKLMQEKSHPSVLCVCSPTYLLLRNKKKVQFFLNKFSENTFFWKLLKQLLFVSISKDFEVKVTI